MVVKADDLIDKLIATALADMEERHPEASKAERERVAAQIAVGALRYFILKFTRAASKVQSAVERAISSGEPAHVAKYAFQLAQSFNNFYHEYPVLHEEQEERRIFLLWLTKYLRDQLVVTLGILGIEVPSYM